MRSSITFHPAPGYRACTIALHACAKPWPALREELARDLGCDEDALWTEDVYWNGNDDTADVVTLDGTIIGSIDRALTVEDIAAINGETVDARRAA